MNAQALTRLALELSPALDEDRERLSAEIQDDWLLAIGVELELVSRAGDDEVVTREHS